MDPKSMTRKDFIVLTFTLVGSAATVAACGSSGATPIDGGITGAGGTAGTTGLGGAGGSAGAAGAAGQGGAGGGTTTACKDPLPEVQDPDQLMHVHTVTVPAATLSATTDQPFTTSTAAAPGQTPHTHNIVLTAAHLATLKGGGTVDVTSTISVGHLHTYSIGCTAA